MVVGGDLVLPLYRPYIPLPHQYQSFQIPFYKLPSPCPSPGQYHRPVPALVNMIIHLYSSHIIPNRQRQQLGILVELSLTSFKGFHIISTPNMTRQIRLLFMPLEHGLDKERLN